jgi:uncharacterized protein (DUF2235 family)
MPKNIVILCDGTGNEFGDRNSNVVKLRQALKNDPPRQVIYYHPGVGTKGATNALTTAGKVWTKIRGLAFGYGLSENIADAYRFLMQTFEAGDQVYLFGFSRGAYTARALCGMLRMFGLLAPGNEGLIPYALRLFKRNDNSLLARLTARPSKFAIAEAFRKAFCSDCAPHFLGLWDTVSSVGWILDPIGLKPGSLPYTKDLKQVGKVRHAVSIDERRAFFRQNLVEQGADRDVKEVWFAGVHSDIGGSYPEAESGLSKISLCWMVREAEAAGLLVESSMMANVLGANGQYAMPLPGAMAHNSLTAAWWLGEFWPKARRRVSQTGDRQRGLLGLPRMNLFRSRSIPEGACLHESVEIRRKVVPMYAPRNLPEFYNVEREPSSNLAPRHLNAEDTMDLAVHARAKWNATPIWVSKGERYRVAASGVWHDASIPCGPAGYESSSLGFRLVAPFRRARKANWFALIGTINQTEATSFVIGDGVEIGVPRDGLLYCFANDLPFMYFNNSGTIRMIVKRLP